MPSEERDQRLHPFSILFGLGQQFRNFIVPGLFVLFTAGVAGWGWQLWVMPLLVPYAVASVGRYLSFRYRYEINELVIRTGFIFKNERHIPYARIQNIDAVRNVFHRLLGVVEVRVETGGGEEPEARLSVLPIAAYEEMRSRVFQGKGQAEVRSDSVATSPLQFLLRLPPRELLLCGLIQGGGGVVTSAAFGVLWELGFWDSITDRLFGEQAWGRGVIRDLLRAVFAGGPMPVSRIALAFGALIGFLLLIRVVSMGWTLIRLHGFTLTREGEDLRTEFGLLTRVAATIPLRRIQTLTVREGPAHRLFERVSVRVDTAGGDKVEGSTKQREWLAPILRTTELPRLLREVLPEIDLAAAEWRAAPPRAHRRAFKKFAIVACGLSLMPVMLLKWWTLALLAILLLWAFVAARKYVTSLGWAVTDAAVLFRSGWIWSHTSIARFAKIQAVAMHESPFDRRAVMAPVRVDTAGASDLSHRVDIPYLPRDIARELVELLATQADSTRFRW